MRHKLVWYGLRELNHAKLEPGMRSFVKKDGSSAEVKHGAVPGIAFGYVSGAHKELYLASIQGLKLKNPVRINENRVFPDRRGPSPKGKLIGEDSAKLLLAAAIASNRSQRIELTKYYGLLREQ
jgi:hypothetical protein